MADEPAEAEWQQDPNIVTPVQLAKELKIRPQIVFGWIRRKILPFHRCECGHFYLLRTEVKDFLDKRRKDEEEKQERIKAELAGETADA